MVPNKLLVNYTLASLSKERCFEKLKAVHDVGVRVLINLMEDDEYNSDGVKIIQYDDWLDEFNESISEPFIYERYPFEDMTAPSKELMKQILDSIDNHNKNGLVVSGACRGSFGRMGTVVGAYLKRHGMATNDNVFDFIDYLRRTEGTGRCSPQRQSQKDFILNWNRNE